MASEFKYEFTDSASRDLDDILDYIAGNLKNPNAAKDLFDGIKAEIKKICMFQVLNDAIWSHVNIYVST